MEGISELFLASNHVFSRYTPSLEIKPSRVTSHNRAINSLPSVDSHCARVSETRLPRLIFACFSAIGVTISWTGICEMMSEFGM